MSLLKLSRTGTAASAVDSGEVKALVSLPVAGLLSDKRATEVAAARPPCSKNPGPKPL